jgi:hypothetical protein
MRRYYHVLLTSDASDLLLLKPRLRLDAMTALGMLARVLGMRERWRAIREAYGLKWSREMSYVPAILTSQTYSSLIEKARKVIGSSNRYRGALEFIALSGLRVGEALDAIRLYHSDGENYLNRELMVLEHFKYPAIFIRKTKKAYITVIDDYMLDLLESTEPVTYNAMSMSIKEEVRKRSLSEHLQEGLGYVHEAKGNRARGHRFASGKDAEEHIPQALLQARYHHAPGSCQGEPGAFEGRAWDRVIAVQHAEHQHH